MEYEQETKWTDQLILQYWLDPENRDSILNAKPLDERLNNKLSDPDSYNPATEKVSQKFPRPEGVMIENPNLRAHPYQCVGKLLWGESYLGSPKEWVTAFYIGSNKIMTVAHAFDNARPNFVGLFVPAMTGDKDIGGENYGCYPIHPSDCQYHPLYSQYQTWNLEYDICTAKVGKGKWMNGNINGKLTEDIMIDESGLTPIEICYEMPDFTTCKILGMQKDLNKQIELNGCYYVHSESNEKKMVIDYEVTKGMSGGPWLVECDGKLKAIGCTAGYYNLHTFSPRFTRNLLEILGLMQ